MFRSSKQIKKDSNRTKENSFDIQENGERIEELEQRINTLTIFAESMWELLKKETQLDDMQLKIMLEEISQKANERRGAKTECPSCTQKLPAKVKKCYYCGKELDNNLEESLFDF